MAIAQSPGRNVLLEPKRAVGRLLAYLHIHDLRRSLASFMANSGADVSLIKSALNHKDIQTTLNVYVRTAKAAELHAREKAHKLMKEFGRKNDDKVVDLKKKRAGKGK